MKQLIPPSTRRRARGVSAVIAGSLVLTLASGYLRPAYADDAVPLTDAQVADVMFGAAVRLKDPGPDYYRSVVATAEVLDWRTTHQSADDTAVTAHLAAVEQKLDAGLTDADRQLSPTELLARQLQ